MKPRLKISFLSALCLISGMIFAQKPIPKTTERFELKMYVGDAETNEALEGTKIKLFNVTKNKYDSAVVSRSGYVSFWLEKGSVYQGLGMNNKYLGRRGELDMACYKKDPNRLFCFTGVELTDMYPIEDGKAVRLEASMAMTRIEIGKTFKIENIYYDYDKSNIRPDAAKELNKLVTILKDNPGIIIELGSHTDSRGSDQYNLELSQRRAEAAVAYIIKQGIPQKRISAKGYGETVVTNKCKNDIPCTDLEHQANRRTEIKITGIL